MMLHVPPLKQACHTAPKKAAGIKEMQAGRWIYSEFQLMGICANQMIFPFDS